MVIKRKSKETLWKEKIGMLEETLEEINKENKTIPLGGALGGGCFRDRKEGEICTEDIKLGFLKTCLYKLEERESKIFKYRRNIIAYLRSDMDNNVIFRATSQEHIPVLEKICKVYERKTLKDEPIIEY